MAGTGEPGYSGDGGPGVRAQLREPNDCFLDGRGGLLIADIQEQRVRRLDLRTGIMTTFAGNGEKVRSWRWQKCHCCKHPWGARGLHGPAWEHVHLRT